MTIVKFERIVSFSSEHPNHKAENLISGVALNSGSKKWRSRDVGEQRLSAILQAPEPVKVSSIDIGNDGSAFVQVLVRRAEQETPENAEDNDGFKTILPASSFLTPLESRNEECMSRVRMFGHEKLSGDAVNQKWDQFKVVCTQPFNKRLRYGLSFFTVNAASKETSLSAADKVDDTKTKRLGAFILKDEADETDALNYKPPVGSLFAAKRTAAIEVTPKTNETTSRLPSVAATLRSDATLASLAINEEDKLKPKRRYPHDGSKKPDLSLIENKSEEPKKRKTDFRHVGAGITESEKEERRLELKRVVDKFVKDSVSDVYDFSSDLNGSDRKLVHEIADELSLIHESVGSGKKRHIVLRKQGAMKGANKQQKQNESQLPRRDVLPGERPLTPPLKATEKKEGNCPRKTETITVTQNVMPSSSTVVPKDTKAKVRLTKPFSRLMEGVKFVISGYQNPLRGEIRQKALEMGARYNADWDRSCTHLVCAFINTPKFNQVRKQSNMAKIVKRDWIECSHNDRIRYPWRRFCLDPSDKKTPMDESEDEIWDEKLIISQDTTDTNVPVSPKGDKVGTPAIDDEYDRDTDDEIEDVLREKQMQEQTTKKDNPEVANINRTEVNKDVKKEDIYDQETDEEGDTVRTETIHNHLTGIKQDENSDEAYNADTDVDEEKENIENGLKCEENGKCTLSNVTTANERLDTKSIPLPTMPSHFLGLRFILYGVYTDEDRKLLNKGIIAAGGAVQKFIAPNVDFVVSSNVKGQNEWDRNFNIALMDNPKVNFVRPQFIMDCYDAGKILENPQYYISNDSC